MQVASATDVTEQLGEVTAPTLVLHRRGMPQIPVEVSRSLALALPRARLVMLEGEQPVLFMEDPDGVVSMLADFVASGVEPPGVASGPEAAATASGRPARSAGLPVPPPGGLSRRELEVLRLLAAGESNAQIARRLDLSTHTVERHVVNLYRKIGARGRTDATAYAIRNALA